MAEKSTEDVLFWIDGKEVRAATGSQLLKAILTVTEIPHICYHSDLMGPIRSCDTCLVEVKLRLQALPPDSDRIGLGPIKCRAICEVKDDLRQWLRSQGVLD